jgi:hypothetical protein
MNMDKENIKFSDLPDDMIREISGYLELEDKSNYRKTNRLLSNIIDLTEDRRKVYHNPDDFEELIFENDRIKIDNFGKNHDQVEIIRINKNVRTFDCKIRIYINGVNAVKGFLYTLFNRKFMRIFKFLDFIIFINISYFSIFNINATAGPLLDGRNLPKSKTKGLVSLIDYKYVINLFLMNGLNFKYIFGILFGNNFYVYQVYNNREGFFGSIFNFKSKINQNIFVYIRENNFGFHDDDKLNYYIVLSTYKNKIFILFSIIFKKNLYIDFISRDFKEKLDKNDINIRSVQYYLTFGNFETKNDEEQITKLLNEMMIEGYNKTIK